MFHLLKENKMLMVAYQNIDVGKPDCWDPVKSYPTLGEAKTALKKARGGRYQVRTEGGEVILWSGDVI